MLLRRVSYHRKAFALSSIISHPIGGVKVNTVFYISVQPKYRTVLNVWGHVYNTGTYPGGIPESSHYIKENLDRGTREDYPARG